MKSLHCFHILQGCYCRPLNKRVGNQRSAGRQRPTVIVLRDGERRGRGEGTVQVAGGEEIPKRHLTAPELVEKYDSWLICSLVWACEKPSLLTEMCLTASPCSGLKTKKLWWKSPPLSVFYQKFSPPTYFRQPLFFQSWQDTLTVPCLTYFRAWYQILKAQSLPPILTWN